MEWDQAKLDQTQNRLQLLCLHVNGSQMREVGKRWDSQPLSTNWICMWNRQRRRWIISLVDRRRKDSECSETLHCSCNEAKRCYMLYVGFFLHAAKMGRRSTATSWIGHKVKINNWLIIPRMESMECRRGEGKKHCWAFITSATTEWWSVHYRSRSVASPTICSRDGASLYSTLDSICQMTKHLPR